MAGGSEGASGTWRLPGQGPGKTGQWQDLHPGVVFMIYGGLVAVLGTYFLLTFLRDNPRMDEDERG